MLPVTSSSVEFPTADSATSSLQPPPTSCVVSASQVYTMAYQSRPLPSTLVTSQVASTASDASVQPASSSYTEITSESIRKKLELIRHYPVETFLHFNELGPYISIRKKEKRSEVLAFFISINNEYVLGDWEGIDEPNHDFFIETK